MYLTSRQKTKLDLNSRFHAYAHSELSGQFRFVLKASSRTSRDIKFSDVYCRVSPAIVAVTCMKKIGCKTLFVVYCVGIYPWQKLRVLYDRHLERLDGYSRFIQMVIWRYSLIIIALLPVLTLWLRFKQFSCPRDQTKCGTIAQSTQLQVS